MSNQAGKRTDERSIAREWGRASLSRNLRHWLTYYVAVPIVYFFMRLLTLTWRIKRKGIERQKLAPSILAIWHGDLIVGASELPYMLPKVQVLTSRSRDGTLVARFVRCYRAGTIRGGSSRGGSGAILLMRRAVAQGNRVIVPVDGPRGPRGKAKVGVVSVASFTGAPIIPGLVVGKNAWRFKSWDRAFVAKPFSEVELVYGEPIMVPKDATREQLEASRLELENRLMEMHAQAGDDCRA